jgi:hypothetical protein
MMLGTILPLSLALLVSTAASASPVCSSIIGEFSCRYKGLSRSESLVLCTNDTLDQPILVVGNSFAHGVQVSQDTNGETRYESELVSLTVSADGDSAIFMNKEQGNSANCTTQL